MIDEYIAAEEDIPLTILKHSLLDRCGVILNTTLRWTPTLKASPLLKEITNETYEDLGDLQDTRFKKRPDLWKFMVDVYLDRNKH